MTERHYADYIDTHEECTACHDGTYVDYPDNVIRCRNCGQTKPQPKKAVAGRKTSE